MTRLSRLAGLTLIAGLIIGLTFRHFRLNRLNREPAQVAVSRQTISSQLTLSGAVTADKTASLRFQTAGKLAWVGIKENQAVSRGQTLLSLDARQLKKSLQKELNDYLTTRWNFADTRDTYLVSDDNLDRYTLTPAARRVLERSQFSLNNAVLDVEIQAVINETAVLSAPFAGLVTDLNFPQPGVTVQPTDPVITIIDPSSLYFNAEVDEVDIAKLRLSQTARLILDSFPEQTLDTVIAAIGFTPLSLSGGGTGYAVRLELGPNPDHRYKPGMNGDAVVTLETHENTLVLPSQAVAETADPAIGAVRRLKSGRIVSVEVTLGLKTDDSVEILSGLVEGDQVLANQD